MPDKVLDSLLIVAPRWHPPVEKLHCLVHLATPAVDRCDRCGHPFCADCLHHLGRWRVCTTCLGRLRRERRGIPLRQRLIGARREVAAVLAIGGLLVGMVVVIGRGIGGGGSDAALGNAAHTIGPKVLLAQQMGAPTAIPASLHLQVPLASVSPPAQIVLGGAGFQPDEQVRVSGTLSGQTGPGQVASVTLTLRRPLPTGTVQATHTGDLVAVALTVPNSSRFFGRYHVEVLATGNEGSRARFAVTAGGEPAPAP